MNNIVFMDTETLGLNPDAPIWEFAAIKRVPNAMGWAEETLHIFIQHDPEPWLAGHREDFAADYHARYDETTAWCPKVAARAISTFIAGAHVIGACPEFDTTRIRRQLLELLGIPDPWHYHLIDVENMIVGYLAATTFAIQPPWHSNELSEAVGVDPEQFRRHTAMGDVEWVRAQYDAVMGGAE